MSSPQHVFDPQCTQAGKPYVRFELDQESEHIEVAPAVAASNEYLLERQSRMLMSSPLPQDI
jgi:hypothetical protein